MKLERSSSNGAAHRRLFLLVCLLYLGHAALFGSWIVDDAGISFAYARNLAAGGGLVAQPGLQPVEGFSNPLWVGLLASAFLLGVFDPVLFPKLLACFLVLAGFGLLARERWRAAEGRAGPAFYVLAATALQPGFVIWTISGLENALYFFLFAAHFVATSLVIEGRDGRLRGWPALAAGIAVGLAVTRPEGVLLAGILPACALLSGDDTPRYCLARYVLAVAVGIAAVVLLRWFYFGDLVPNTFHVKGAGTSAKALRAVLGMAGIVVLVGLARTKTKPTGAWSVLLFLVVAAFLLWLPRIDRLLRSVGGPLGLVLATLLLLGVVRVPGRIAGRRLILLVHLCFATLVHEVLPRDWMGEYRFGTLFFPFFFLAALDHVPDALRSLRFSPRVAAASAAAASLVYAGHAAMRSLAFRAQPTVPLATVERDFHRPFLELRRVLGSQLESVLIPDVGAMLYLSPLRVHDLSGLCDREIARALFLDRAGLFDEIFARRKPDLITLHGSLASWCRLGLDPRLARDYEKLRTYESRSDLPGFESGLFIRTELLAGEEHKNKLIRLLER